MITPEPADVAAIAAARAEVLGQIDAAARRAGRDPETVRVVAVTKTVSVERVAAAVTAGLALLGENRVQEAEAKKPAVTGATWHLIGPLQSNKARRAVETFDVVESVDGIELARRLARVAAEIRPGHRLPVLLQVNVDGDPSKAGYDPATLERDMPELLELAELRVAGLMTIGRLVTEPEAARPTFAGLRELRDGLQARHSGLGPELSMGMSDDYPVAVEEGATLLRIGRAIFGERR